MCVLNFVVLTIFVFVRKDGESIITSSSEEGSLRKDVRDTTLSKTRLCLSVIIVVVACANHWSFAGRHIYHVMTAAFPRSHCRDRPEDSHPLQLVLTRALQTC